MLFFWLRFFGYRQDKLSAAEDEDDAAPATIVPGRYCSQPRKSIMYHPAEIRIEHSPAPLDGDLATARRGTQRRAAIDLDRGDSVLGSLRISVDALPTRQHNMSVPLHSYTDFTIMHKGRLSKIVSASHKFTGEEVAIKMYDRTVMSAIQLEDIAREIDILVMAKGVDGIVQYEKADNGKYLTAIVLKGCTGGTLAKRLANAGGRMPEVMCVRDVVKPLVSALAWLHEHNVVHRNLKPQHILFDDEDELRICDFFIAAVMGKTALVGREGSLAYMAPEMVTKPTDDEIFHEVIDNGISETDLPSYNEKVDIWSLGVITVELLTGHKPFIANTPGEMAAVQKQELQGDRWGGVLDFIRDQEFLSLSGQDFLSSILRIDPRDRPSARALMAHPWLDTVHSDLEA
ncbi:unnamed protein product [Ostreobium quekettii]|uniref:Protein kinase domain-containing protein n=1 Tax=Ostreobium quekettii TaxID=121088 RepID=A0A8S1IYN9_9CHLO|nr:unnamed protein product [Ostreobium quekettii]|eukprot:evm.model.scf_92.11 EVM.evm.TU.scf_92.11   scf_92:143192-146392(-)